MQCSVHGCVPRGLVRQVRLVVLVVERLAEVDDAENEQQEEREDERELDERDPVLADEVPPLMPPKASQQ